MHQKTPLKIKNLLVLLTARLPGITHRTLNQFLTPDYISSMAMDWAKPFLIKRLIHVKLAKNFYSIACLSISSYPFMILHLENNLLALSQLGRDGQAGATKDPAQKCWAIQQSPSWNTQQSVPLCNHWLFPPIPKSISSYYSLRKFQICLHKRICSRKHWLSNANFFPPNTPLKLSINNFFLQLTCVIRPAERS